MFNLLGMARTPATKHEDDERHPLTGAMGHAAAANPTLMGSVSPAGVGFPPLAEDASQPLALAEGQNAAEGRRAPPIAPPEAETSTDPKKAALVRIFELMLTSMTPEKAARLASEAGLSATATPLAQAWADMSPTATAAQRNTPEASPLARAWAAAAQRNTPEASPLARAWAVATAGTERGTRAASPTPPAATAGTERGTRAASPTPRPSMLAGTVQPTETERTAESMRLGLLTVCRKLGIPADPEAMSLHLLAMMEPFALPGPKPTAAEADAEKLTLGALTVTSPKPAQLLTTADKLCVHYRNYPKGHHRGMLMLKVATRETLVDLRTQDPRFWGEWDGGSIPKEMLAGAKEDFTGEGLCPPGSPLRELIFAALCFALPGSKKPVVKPSTALRRKLATEKITLPVTRAAERHVTLAKLEALLRVTELVEASDPLSRPPQGWWALLSSPRDLEEEATDLPNFVHPELLVPLLADMEKTRGELGPYILDMAPEAQVKAIMREALAPERVTFLKAKRDYGDYDSAAYEKMLATTGAPEPAAVRAVHARPPMTCHKCKQPGHSWAQCTSQTTAPRTPAPQASQQPSAGGWEKAAQAGGWERVGRAPASATPPSAGGGGGGGDAKGGKGRVSFHAADAEALPCPLRGTSNHGVHSTGECTARCPVLGHGGHRVQECSMGGRPRPAAVRVVTATERSPQQPAWDEAPSSWDKGTLVIKEGVPEVMLYAAGFKPDAPGARFTPSLVLFDSGSQLTLVPQDAVPEDAERRALPTAITLTLALNTTTTEQVKLNLLLVTSTPHTGAMSGVGLDPGVLHTHAEVWAHVVPTLAFEGIAASINPEVGTLKLLVGTDSHASMGDLELATTAARTGLGPPIYSHPTLASRLRNGSDTRGTLFEPVRFVVSVPYDADAPEDIMDPSGLRALPEPEYADLPGLIKTGTAPARRPWHGGEPPTEDELWDLMKPNIGPLGHKYKDLLLGVLMENVDVFKDPSPNEVTLLRFELKPGAPIRQHGLRRTMPPQQEEAVWKAAQEGVKCGDLEEVPYSADLFIHPYVLVPKDNGFRICLNLAHGGQESFNNNLANNTRSTALPSLPAHIAALARPDHALHSNIDLAKAFKQCIVDKGSRHLLAQCARDPADGVMHFYVNRAMVFGETSMPGVFQEVIEEVIEPVLTLEQCFTIIQAFLDNLDLATKLQKEATGTPPRPPEEAEREMVADHVRTLGVLFGSLRARKLVISPSKTRLLWGDSVTMGVIIRDGTVTLDPARLSGLDGLEVPPESGATLQWLRKLAGVLNYLMPHGGMEFGTLVAPLYAVLRAATAAEDVATKANDRAGLRAARGPQAAYDTKVQDNIKKIAEIIKTSRGLITLDAENPGSPLYGTGDASDTGAAFYFYQADSKDGSPRFLAIWRGAFTPQQLKWPVACRELWAALQGIRRYYRMLAGRKGAFVLMGDHLNLLSIEMLEQPFVSRWLAEIMAMVPTMGTLLHISGRAHILADYLSRYGPPAAPAAPLRTRAPTFTSGDIALVRVVRPGVKNPHRSSFSALGREVLAAQQMMEPEELLIEKNKLGTEVKMLDDLKVLFRHGKLMVPLGAEALRAKLYTLVHNESLHIGYEKGLALLDKTLLSVENARTELRRFIGSCPACQFARAPLAPDPTTTKMLLPPPSRPWERIQMDYASLPVDADNREVAGIIVVVDTSTRLAMLEPVKGATAAEAARTLGLWCRHHVKPEIVGTDGGPTFGGAFIAKCEELDIAREVGTAYNSQGRGIVERLIGTAKGALKRVLPPNAKLEWQAALPQIEYMLNNIMPHASLGGMTPTSLAFLAAPRAQPTALLGLDPTPQRWEDMTAALVAMRAVASLSSEVCSIRSKVRHDETTTPIHYTVGAWVLLWYPVRATSLDSFYQGPYKVVGLSGDGFYEVAPLLAGDVLGAPTVVVHASRMLAFDHSRTSSELEHQKRLPPGYHVVKDVIDGPREDGRFEVSWHFLDKTTWEPIEGLRSTAQYKAYCAAHNINVNTGKPLLARTRGKQSKR